MSKQIFYDITTYNSSLNSLSKLTEQNVNDIENFIMINGEDYFANHFLEEFDVNDFQLLEKDLWLVSLHVTTNNDNCNSIKKHGLLNLQQTISLDTPFNQFLEEHKIKIDLEQKTVQHKEDVYDISKEYSGFSDDEKERALDFIIYKLFEDYQINGFFSNDNVLDYGGYVNRRPEFLYNLGEFLNLPDLEYDWAKNNKCYVVKFAAPINDYTDWTFMNKSEYKYLDKEEIEIRKRKRMINESLTNIHYGFFDKTLTESYSYIHPNKRIPYSNIIEVYTDEEYLKSNE
ncbi:hypothetical protein [Oceanobacillus chungangensis]|uniref:Uncharacterized protein n=1 Tax=Oceanobacillus chungangensis TaxID=1229152 RepID=A0A3D8PUE1_9BACI|nr:hypothetical protein [Oceanobacillus chungangensis]RDW18769.1 hypothetical protein CWR45_09245 [Oceanobacillus chungangensis]